jgi:transcription initiation factor TFIIIB Brf1 subunit/transcription initiation factor TFIIB
MDSCCKHQERVDDLSTGDEVCCQCGLVLSQVMLHPQPAVWPQKQSSPLQRPHQWLNFLLDACHNANLPPEAAQRSHDLFISMRASPRVGGARLDSVASYALYCTLASEGAGTTPADICAITGADLKQLCRLQKIFPQQEVEAFNDPKSYLGRFCYALNLTRTDEMRLRRIADRAQLEGYRPTTVAAALIFSYCARTNQSIDIRSISEQCCVSSESIRRAAAKIDKMYPEMYLSSAMK